MNYNYDFDIASLILYAVIFGAYFWTKHIKNTTSKVFFAMLVASTCIPLLDIAGCEVITRGCNAIIVNIVNNLYYLSEQVTNFLFLVYVLSILEMSSRMKIWQKAVILFPFGINALVILTNPVHCLLYKYGFDNIWITGPYRAVIVFLPVFYFGYAVVYAVLRAGTLSNKDLAIIISIAILNTSARFIQYFIPSFLIYSFSVAVGVLLLFVGFQVNRKLIDTETGLGNKTYLADNTKRFIYNKVPFTMILVRIVDYDAMTTNYGIDGAEDFIKYVASKLQSMFPRAEVYHISNSCFAITLLGEEQYKTEESKKKIAATLDDPWQVNGLEIACTYFVTSVAYPTQCIDRDTLLTYMTYFQNMRGIRYGIIPCEKLNISDTKRENDVASAIERAIKNDGFAVYYQPMCISKTQEFVTAEALIRLNDPELGFISPAEFIPIAEANGSIITIGNIVLEKVCAFISRDDWDELGLHSIEMNLSAAQVLQRNFIKVVKGITEKYNIDKSRLNFEITETASNNAPAVFTENLALLRKEGYHLIPDDFGSGYSNLQRLVTSEFDMIKFDKEMTQRTCDDYKLHEFFERMQNIFHSMGAKVVAEGVETKDQFEFLRSIGCDYIQGYYFSKAVPSDEFVAFIKRHRQSL